MRNKGSLLILVFILILTLSVSAQDKEQKWRNFEVSVTGGMTAPSQTLTDWKDSLGAKTGLHFGGSGGYCFTNMLSAGVYFIYSQMAMKENYGLHFQMYDFGGYAKVAFGGESYFEPYFKVSAGANSVKLPTWVTPTRKLLREKAYDAGLSLGGYAGLLYYTSDYGGIFVEAGYHHDLLKDVKADYHGEIYKLGGDVNYLELRGGLMVFFGPE